jgi:hypothetical protein
MSPEGNPLPNPLNRLVLAVALVVVLCAGTAVAARLMSTERTTQLGLFDASGRLAKRYKVTATRSGTCFTSSLAVDGRDAWRCIAGNRILDPCFQPPKGHGPLACLSDPWGTVTRLRLTRHLPKPTPVHETRPMPWAVETSSGLRCTKLTGATDVYRGQRVNYECTDGSVLVGDVDDSSKQWTIMRSPSGHPERGDLARVNLKRAFRP